MRTGSQSVTSTSESQPNRAVLGLGGVPEEQLLHRNVQLIRGGLVCKAHRLLYRSTLGLIVMKKKKRKGTRSPAGSQTLVSLNSRLEKNKEEEEAYQKASCRRSVHRHQLLLRGLRLRVCGLQGFLVHKKPPPRRTLQQGYA